MGGDLLGCGQAGHDRRDAFVTLEWVDWFNNRRLLEPICDIPPAEYDMLYWTESGGTDTIELTDLRLH